MGEDAAARARTARNLVEQLAARIPGFRGYLERELRREVDQLLRAELANRIDAARQSVDAHVRRLPLAAATELSRLASVDKRLDAVANRLRHAGSGYAGLFDAVKVREAELERLYRYDLSLVEGVDDLQRAAERLESEGLDAVAGLAAALKSLRAAVNGRDEVVKSAFAG